jgi:hypothetical protein
MKRAYAYLQWNGCDGKFPHTLYANHVARHCQARTVKWKSSFLKRARYLHVAWQFLIKATSTCHLHHVREICCNTVTLLRDGQLINGFIFDLTTPVIRNWHRSTQIKPQLKNWSLTSSELWKHFLLTTCNDRAAAICSYDRNECRGRGFSTCASFSGDATFTARWPAILTGFSWFSQTIHACSGVESKSALWSFPSTSFPINYSLIIRSFNAIQSQLLTVIINEQKKKPQCRHTLNVSNCATQLLYLRQV